MVQYIVEKIGWLFFTAGLLSAMVCVITHSQGKPLAISCLMLIAGVIILEFSDEGDM